MRKRNHTVTIRMNDKEYTLLRQKMKESGQTQQAVVLAAIENVEIVSSEVKEELKKQNINATLINPCFISGVDKELLEDNEFTSVGGWVIDKLERFAKIGDSFDYENLTVTVLDATEFTVEKVKIVKHKIEEE